MPVQKEDCRSCGEDCRQLVELREQLEEVSLKLEMITANIPGGVLVYEAEAGKILSVSEGCLNLLHCTEEEFRDKYYNNFYMMICKQDRNLVRRQVEEQIRYFDSVVLNYRIEGFLGELLWISHSSRRIRERDGREVFYAVLSDVTEEKLMQQRMQEKQEELYWERKRYRLLEEAVSDIQFDYDIGRDVFSYSQKDEQGNYKTISGYRREDKIKEYIHPEDCQVIREVFGRAMKTVEKGSVEYRSRLLSGEYRWYRLSYASFADQNEQVVLIMGSIKDADEEKREQELLRRWVKHDGMTGLLNKTAIQVSVKEFLKHTGGDAIHALLVIDTDNFKMVNDTLGHAYGDKVIKIVAGAIKATFRESDYVGRIGGDEFMVFMVNTTKQITEDRAAKLNQALRMTFTEETGCVSISTSIGIAYYGEHGREYQELFHCADMALYQSKEQGKDCYAVAGGVK